MFLSLLCGCPPQTEITSFSFENCIESIGQIQRLIFQRTKNGFVENEIVIATTPPDLGATWNPLFLANDSTKAVVTPFVSEPNLEPGEARTYGGGNATLGGTVKVLGSQPSTFTGKFLDLAQVDAEILKGYMCEGISIYLVNEHNQVIGLTDDHASPSIFKGIPAKSFFVSDKKLGMFEEPDSNMISFQFLPGWSDKLHIVTMTDFNFLA